MCSSDPYIYIDEAEMNFRKALKEDNPVFKAIEEIRKIAGKPSQ
jgi:hypothetical protein